MRSFVLLLPALLAAACVALTPPPFSSAPTPPAAQSIAQAADIEAGHRLAQMHCARCHAIGASGDSPFSPAPPFRTLSQRYDVGQLEEAFGEGILVGHPAMPEFRFEEEQIAQLVAYLESVQPRRGL